MLYIDQPIGTGFSYGTDNVDSTFTAASAIWTVIQTLFDSPEFSAYSSREFILATESYGGHYGSEFADYFQIQNNLIAAGKLSGVQIRLGALLINKYAPTCSPSMYNTEDFPVAGSTLSSKTSSTSTSRRTRLDTVLSRALRQLRR